MGWFHSCGDSSCPFAPMIPLSHLQDTCNQVFSLSIKDIAQAVTVHNQQWGLESLQHHRYCVTLEA